MGYQTVDVKWRDRDDYDTLRVHGVTYLFYGRDEDIRLTSGEHASHRWLPFEEARGAVKIGEYATRFFDRWRERRWEIMQRVARPVSIAFQVTEECPIGCLFCLRRQDGENDLTLADRKEIVDILASRGIVRLTITGGEPLIKTKKKETLELLEYVHQKRIHTCLSTTGLNLLEGDIERLERCLDQILLSVHSVDADDAAGLYERVPVWKAVVGQAQKVLEWLRDTPIIVETSTVVSKVNRDNLVGLGQWLFDLNPRVFWRIEEYYANGAQKHQRDRFELTMGEFEQVESELRAAGFPPERLRFSSKESRVHAPDIMITPQGNLVTSSNMKYDLQGDTHDLLFIDLRNRRPWTQYRDCVRTGWNW